MTADGFCVDDLWTPASGAALPQGAVLTEIADRCGRVWEAPGLGATVRIGYSNRLRTSLGRAFLDDGRVELNPRLLLNHPEEMIPTLVHELAHLVVYRRFGRVAPHGIQFRTLMRAANLSAAATHDLPVEGLKRTRKRYLYLHKCTVCGQTFVARKVRRGYHCATCGPASSFDVFRTVDNDEGRKLIEKTISENSR